jgi:hypothetical protein
MQPGAAPQKSLAVARHPQKTVIPNRVAGGTGSAALGGSSMRSVVQAGHHPRLLPLPTASSQTASPAPNAAQPVPPAPRFGMTML